MHGRPLVGGRKHTAILMGPAGVHGLTGDVDDLGLNEGETVIVAGTYHEYEWQAGKPKAKQIRNVTRLAVLRDNVWHEAGVIDGEVAEAAPEDPSAPSSSPAPTTASTTSSPSATEPDTSEASAPSRGSRPSADSGSETTTTDDEDASSTPAETTSTDLTAEAQEAFGDMLVDADVEEAPELPFDVPAAMELPVWGEEEGTFDGPATVISVALADAGPSRKVAHLWLVPRDKAGVRFQAFMPQDEADAQGVFDRGQGEMIRAVGGWKVNPVSKSRILVLTAVVDA